MFQLQTVKGKASHAKLATLAEREGARAENSGPQQPQEQTTKCGNGCIELGGSARSEGGSGENHFTAFCVTAECTSTNKRNIGEEGASSESRHIIPGVEHIFFEKELEKMENANSTGHIVVLAVDNSAPSDMAFKFYVENVSRPGYLLHLVHHSNYWGNFEPMDGGPSPKHCQELMVKEDTKVKEIESKYRKLMADNNIVGDFIVLRGKDAWHDIIQYQEKVNGIMIVMGTRGQNTLRRTFMGSVSDSVVHHASCPVLVCCHPKH
ncbi:hypothetical protein Btru_042370 [Bulinus truncatus]|nr:hypothetical protein Btru_042370 [Bulinus truncatus]